MVELPLTTRQFTPESYDDEITANINGSPIFPPHNADIPPGSLRIINIFVSAKGLPNVKFFSKTDPLCAMFVQGDHGWHEYGRTEVSWDILNPLWIRPFTFHVKENPELLRFEVYDIISDQCTLGAQKQIGECEVELSTLLRSPTHSLELTIFDPKNQEPKGILNVHFYDIAPCQGSLFFNINCRKLVKKRSFQHLNPFFILQRFPKYSQQFTAVYKSSVKRNTTNPDWENVEFALQYTCSGDTSTSVRILVMNHKDKDFDNMIGFIDTTFDFLKEQGKVEMDLHDNEGHKTGQINISFVQHFERPRLFDYRLRGVQLSTMFAIDFSSTSYDGLYSNRIQHSDSGNFSYRAAINDLTDVLLPLTMGQSYLAYGFADFPGDEKVFSLTSVDKISKRSEYIPNAKNLMHLYSSYKEKTMYPPKCRLAPVFRKCREIAIQRWREEHTISILVILTNGKFCDLPEAIDALVEAEKDPLVVLMVVLGTNRRDLDNTFKNKNGVICNSTGHMTARKMVTLTTFQEEKVFNLSRLPRKLNMSVKKMARQWLEFTRFEAPAIVHTENLKDIMPIRKYSDVNLIDFD